LQNLVADFDVLSAPEHRGAPRLNTAVAPMSVPLAARLLAEQAFSRAAGAPLVHGNAVRLLRDARENYPAWLDAIGTAAASVHFEMYMAHADEVGDRFADALVAKARQGVPVRVVYDWLGALGVGRRRLWRRLREGGVEVRCFNPARCRKKSDRSRGRCPTEARLRSASWPRRRARAGSTGSIP
jgi:phosphatidylserine/phosphatidylglycerophosphate/cardiolipin synthase-like enzyme